MADNKEIHQVLATFYKEVVAFARQDDNKQEEYRRKLYIRDQLAAIQSTFGKEWVNPPSSLEGESCFPSCTKPWRCIGGNCHPPMYLGEGEPPTS